MRHVWLWLRGLGGVFLVVAGCATTDPDLKPPKREEEYVLPPDDPRFVKPIEYRTEDLDSGKKKRRLDASPLNDPSRLGATRPSASRGY